MTTKKSEALKKSDLKRFKQILEEKRDALIKAARDSLQDDMALDTNDLPDEMDLASSEYLQSFTFRLRGRERFFLDKIEQALKRIEDGSFGFCESCEEPISIKRLEARPRPRSASAAKRIRSASSATSAEAIARPSPTGIQGRARFAVAPLISTGV
jgi:DnaK suppressor protein